MDLSKSVRAEQTGINILKMIQVWSLIRIKNKSIYNLYSFNLRMINTISTSFRKILF